MAEERVSTDPSKLLSGWLADPPSERDFTPAHDAVRSFAEGLDLLDPDRSRLPPRVDMSSEFLPPINQGPAGTCTAVSAVALFEYTCKLVHGKHTRGSALFVYKVARNFMMRVGDVGSHPRTAMKTLAVVGVCPEKYWPYDLAALDREPPAFCYAVADDFRALRYYRLDSPDTRSDLLLARVRAHLAAGLPLMFGADLYSELDAGTQPGYLRFPGPRDSLVLRHAMVVVGYDDTLELSCADPAIGRTRGALRVRNSWGTGWGEGGYGWLPYDYVLRNLARDFWCIMLTEWLELDRFERLVR